MSDQEQKPDEVQKKLLLALKAANYELKLEKDKKSEPIAIIGASCRLPGGANSLDAYWDLLINGKDAVVEVPNDRWSLDEYYDADSFEPNKMYCKWGGFLDTKVQYFDATFFEISSVEAQMMDPQQRLVLEVTWEAMESANIIASEIKGSNTGVFFGVSTSDYIEIVRRSKDITAYTNSGLAHSVLAGRVSYELGLQGPSFVLDTACSSSLVAIHQACRSLREAESNLAIAGGVNLMLTPDLTIGFCKGRFLAEDGRCKTFDESANGYVRGEGCGVVVLKRLSDAKRDGDNILAVIRGSAVNQDGASGGLTVPNGPAQEAVIRQALMNGNVKPNEIDYVEAHGTGTPLGDPIEIHAIENVLKQGRSIEQELVVTSVKTNIGHLEAAAGMASVIKVILALKYQQIPKHLHFNILNHNVNLDGDIKLVIPTENVKWPRNANRRRIAGISGFAFQGTNAHVIIEEAPMDTESHPQDKPNNYVDRSFDVLTISAKNTDALKDLVQLYIKLLNDNCEFADVAFSANTSRARFNQRLAVVAKDAKQASEQLQIWLDSGDASGVTFGEHTTQDTPKIAFLFGGQDSQYVGMGKELYKTSPIFKKFLDECASILEENKYLDKPLLSLLWGDDSKLLDEIKYTQPALFALEYALYQLWASWGVIPGAVTGHNVGEYVAATVAGVMSLQDGLLLISKRVTIMQALPQNGSKVAIDPVLMQSLLEDLNIVLSQIKLKEPTITLISNITGSVIDKEKIAKSQYWLDHVMSTVQSPDSMKTLFDLGYDIVVEVGSHPTSVEILNKYTKENHVSFYTLRRDGNDWYEILTNLAGLYVSGVFINWREFDRDYIRQKIQLPTYPFQRQRYWLDVDDHLKNE